MHFSISTVTALSLEIALCSMDILTINSSNQEYGISFHCESPSISLSIFYHFQHIGLSPPWLSLFLYILSILGLKMFWKLIYNTVCFQIYNIVIQYFYGLCSIWNCKILAVFPVLCDMYLQPVYFTHSTLCLWIPYLILPLSQLSVHRWPLIYSLYLWDYFCFIMFI